MELNNYFSSSITSVKTYVTLNDVEMRVTENIKEENNHSIDARFFPKLNCLSDIYPKKEHILVTITVNLRTGFVGHSQ